MNIRYNLLCRQYRNTLVCAIILCEKLIQMHVKNQCKPSVFLCLFSTEIVQSFTGSKRFVSVDRLDKNPC